MPVVKPISMKTISTLIFSVLVALAAQAEVKWHTDVQEATKLAKKENKALFLNFTGSDWCQYCVHNEKTVFSQAAFDSYVKKNMVCVLLDFPRKNELPQALIEQNNQLKFQYAVKGFPTYWILNHQLERLGKLEGGANSAVRFIEQVDEIIHPEKHSAKINWRKNEDFDQDISTAIAVAKANNQKVIHYLDNSSFSNAPHILGKAVIHSSSFAKYINKNYVPLRTKVSTMFPPIDMLKLPDDKEMIDKFNAYVKKHNIAEDEYDRCCYSLGEYLLRNELGCKRSDLPALAVLSSEGKLIRLIKYKDINLQSTDPVKDLTKLLEDAK